MIHFETKIVDDSVELFLKILFVGLDIVCILVDIPGHVAVFVPIGKIRAKATCIGLVLLDELITIEVVHFE